MVLEWGILQYFSTLILCYKMILVLCYCGRVQLWYFDTVLHCYCVQLCQSSSLAGGSQDASSSHVIQPFSLLIFMLYMLYNPLQPTIHVLNVKQPFSRLIVVVPVTRSNVRQHFRLSICWCFGWVGRIESEQIQITIWWRDEQACLGVVGVVSFWKETRWHL